MDKTAIIIAVLGSGGVWAVLNNIVSYFVRKFDKKNDEIETHGKALRGLLYGELERRCTGYIRAGGISASDLNTLRKYYYEPYKLLNGDGVIDSLMARVEALPILEE